MNKTLTQEILPKGFEYKSNDAFIQDFWVTQLEDSMDKNPRGELIYRGKSLRQFIAHQRAVASIIEGQARKIEQAQKTIQKMATMSVWTFILFKFISRGRTIKKL